MIMTKEDVLEIEQDLTSTCDLQCPLCTRNYSHFDLPPKLIRPLEDIISQLDTFTNLERMYIAGQYSEPLLHPRFLEYLGYLKDRGIMVEIYSNASKLNLKLWEDIGNLLDENDQVHFTICGSTQELHETYRVGSNLQNILDNAEALRNVIAIDYCQFIEFEYNKNDDVTSFPFTNYYAVKTEGDRFLNEKRVEPLEGVKPTDTRDRLIKQIFKNIPAEGKIKCKSLEDKKVYINVQGQISPCYIHAEYYPKEDFNFDYTKIINFSYDKCGLCEEKTRCNIERFGLDFVC